MPPATSKTGDAEERGVLAVARRSQAAVAIVSIVAGAVLGAASMLVAAGRAEASSEYRLVAVEVLAKDSASRVAKLEKHRIADAWNLYSVCVAVNAPLCTRPAQE